MSVSSLLPRSVFTRLFAAPLLGGLLLLAAVYGVLPSARAQTGVVKVIHSFAPLNPTGLTPEAGLLRGADGNFYGTTPDGGTFGAGTVFKLTPDGVVTTLFSFSLKASANSQANVGGNQPIGGLIQDGAGNFIGTASRGGASGNGTIFKLTPAGVLSVLHDFTALDGNSANTDGAHPLAALVQGSDGNFYGTASDGGANGNGTIFKLSASGTFTTLRSLSISSGDSNADGTNPNAPLIQATDGALYGTAPSGGTGNRGSIFKITTTGTFTPLHLFAGSEGNKPVGGLVQGNDGKFYGAVQFGGTNNTGTIFRMDTAGNVTTLHPFTALDANKENSDGAHPKATLLLGTDGNFYGSTSDGGGTGTGTLFLLTPAGGFTLLYTFSEPDLYGSNSDGRLVQAALVQGDDGNFYGLANHGGRADLGTAFQLTPDGLFTTLYSFPNSDSNDGGAQPIGGVTLGLDGNFYGTTTKGGGEGSGTVYKVTPAGAFTTVLNFGDFDASDDGASPRGNLLRAADGSFYGTTEFGGADGDGTIFRLTPAGTVTILHDFGVRDNDGNNNDGFAPEAGLTLGPDGNFYGVTTGGGTEDDGLVFRLTPNGAFTTLHKFNNNDGRRPSAPLVLGNDGKFYGTTDAGGSGDTGTIFRITTTGGRTTLHTFSSRSSDGTNADGVEPEAGLVQGADGNFYGSTASGGAHDVGTIYSVTPGGVFHVLHQFDALDANGINQDGAQPFFALLPAADGNFYGTTLIGGPAGAGTIFEITPGGVYTVLFSFAAAAQELPNATGANPASSLFQAANGCFYGTTLLGGSGGMGTVYALTLPPVITSPATAGATQGSAFNYQITATNGPTSFGVLGLPPGLTVNSKTGLISGTPTVSGTKMLTLKAANAAGVGQQVLTLTITASVPVITSAATATATVGVAFNYKITATNQPTSFGVLGLPPGLKVDNKTGIISGTPTGAPGTKNLTLKAANTAGTGMAPLTLTIKAG